MTNHIEELMKAAGVDRLPRPCNECEHYMDCGSGCQTPYPTFTPTKQLELIKLITNIKEVECFYIQANKNGYKISCLLETTNFAASVIATDTAMEIALAKLLIKLLKKCELDKSEVKRILEDAN